MKNYPEITDHLNKNMAGLAADTPGVMGAFGTLLNETTGKADTALNVKTKELIALAIAIAIRCEGCIAHHAKAVVDAGINRDELVDTIGVSILMGGGPSVVYGMEALEAFDQFQEHKQ